MSSYLPVFFHGILPYVHICVYNSMYNFHIKNATNYTVKYDNRQQNDDDGDMITKHKRIILSFWYIPEIRSLTNDTDSSGEAGSSFSFLTIMSTPDRELTHGHVLLFRPYHQMYLLDHVLCRYLFVCVSLIGGLKIRPQFDIKQETSASLNQHLC